MENKKVDVEELGKVSGGYYFYNQDGTIDIINDNNGAVVCTLSADKDEDYIKNICLKLGQSPYLITGSELESIRSL